MCSVMYKGLQLENITFVSRGTVALLSCDYPVVSLDQCSEDVLISGTEAILFGFGSSGM